MTPDASTSGPALSSASELGAALAEPARQAAGVQSPRRAALEEHTAPAAAQPEALEQRPAPGTGEEEEFCVGGPGDALCILRLAIPPARPCAMYTKLDLILCSWLNDGIW